MSALAPSPDPRAADLADLFARMRDALASMSVLPEVPAAPLRRDRISCGGGHASAPPRLLSGDSLHWTHGRRFAAWRRNPGADPSLGRLHQIVAAAEADLDAARGLLHEPPPYETPTMRRERIIAEYRGVHAREAAVRERCSVTWIRRVRMDAGLDALTGSEAR